MIIDALNNKADAYYAKNIIQRNFKILQQYTETKSKKHNRYHIDNDFAIQCLFALTTHSFQINYNTSLNNAVIIKKISKVIK